MITVLCPNCGQGVVDDGRQIGQLVLCPRCAATFVIVAPPPIPPPVQDLSRSVLGQSTERPRFTTKVIGLAAIAILAFTVIGLAGFLVGRRKNDGYPTTPVAGSALMPEMAPAAMPPGPFDSKENDGTAVIAKEMAATADSISIAPPVVESPNPRLSPNEPNSTHLFELSELVELVERSIVRIDVIGERGKSQGSGFIVDTEGLVVTNYHVIEQCLSVELLLNDGEIASTVGIVYLDKQRDLAVLKTSKFNDSHPALLLEVSRPRKGDSVFAFGSPLGLSFSASSGIISGIRESEELALLFGPTTGESASLGTWIQTTAPISPGNSGGPLINSRGRVVGISTFKVRSGENINFAISSEDIQKAVISADLANPLPFIEHDLVNGNYL